VQIPIAVSIGVMLHRKGVGLLLPSIAALTVMYLSVIYGDTGILGEWNAAMAGWSIWTWVVVLLGYSYVASVLPVWTLLQPRDYVNSLQLISALALIMLGLFAAAIAGGAGDAKLTMVAPAFNPHPEGAPMIFPFLFITIACGAVSGFHCLVSSGTSSKQISSEPDARFVGYGSMLMEGFLATLVILACGAGLGLGVTTAGGETLIGEAAWAERYASWGAAKGLGAKVGAFVDGSANFLMALGLSAGVAVALMGVLVASFAGTTLDTACRLQRYVIQELGRTLSPEDGGGFAWLKNKHGATIFAVCIAGAMAAVPPSGSEWTLANAGKGGLILWPLFGATNQLLAGLCFMVITFYLWRRGKPVWFLVIPMIFMLIMPLWAMLHQLFSAPGWLVGENPDYLLGGIGLATVALEIWMIFEGWQLFPKAKGVLEDGALDAETA